MFRQSDQPPPPPPREKPSRLRRRRWGTDISVTGLVYCLLMLFMGIAAINTQANLLFAVFGLMIGILLVSFLLSRLVLSRLEVRRMLPDHAIVGRPVSVSYAVRNNKHFWPTLSLTLTEISDDAGFTRQPQAYVLHAAPRMTAVVPVELTPRRRGLLTLDRLQITTSFPFGFIKRNVIQGHHATLLVFPPIGEVDARVLALMRSADSTGTTTRPRPGGQDEFFGTRDYRPGDPPRSIHWKRSATALARQQLVTKEMTQVSPPRLLVVVDNHVPGQATPAQVGDAERAIAMAASLIDEAIRRQLEAGLVVHTDTGITALPPNRGKRHRREALTILATVPSNVTHSAAALLEAARTGARKDVTLVLITPRSEMTQPGSTERNRPVVLSSAADGDLYVRFAPGLDFSRMGPSR